MLPAVCTPSRQHRPDGTIKLVHACTQLLIGPVYLSCYYISPQRALGFVDDSNLQEYLRQAATFESVSTNGLIRTAVTNQFEKALWARLRHSPVPTLTELLLQGLPQVGSVFVHRALYWCKGVPQAIMHPRRSPLPHVRTQVVNGAGQSLNLLAPFSVGDLTSSSTSEFLSGKKELTLIAAVSDVKPGEIEAKPIAIGQFYFNALQGGEEAELWTDSQNQFYVAAESVDSFNEMRRVPPPSTTDVDVLRRIPESDVKHAVAEIVGEPYVGKDWGGEASDLFSARVELRGRRVLTAFIFKGPAKYRPMTLAELGKNGDQLVRAFNEPADLVVVQHCHQITSPVWEVARALAARPGRVKRFTMLDGGETLRLLRAYGKCGQHVG